MSKFLRIILILIGVVFTLLYIHTAIRRVIFPYPLQHVMEGEIFAHVLRVREGLAVYPAWGSDFTPLLYMPLHYYIGALFNAVIPGLLGLRIFSCLAILAAYVIVVLILRNEKSPTWAIIVTMGLLSCISPLMFGSWEQVIIDGVMLALILWGGYLVAAANVPMSRVMASGIIFAAAFFFKQTVAPFIPAMLLFLFFNNRRVLAAFLLSFIAAFASLELLLFFVAGPGYIFYTFTVPLASHTNLFLFIYDIPLVLYWVFPLAFLLILSFVRFGRNMKAGPVIILFIYFLPAAFLIYTLGRGFYLGWLNNFLPFGVISLVLFGWAIGKFPDPPQRMESRWKALLVFGLVIIQFLVLRCNPMYIVPDKWNYRMNEDAVRVIAALDGEVYLPEDTYLAYLAGRKMYGNYVTLQNTWKSERVSGFPGELAEKFYNGEIKYILVGISERLKPEDVPEGIYERLIDRGYIVPPEDYPTRTLIFLPPVHLFEIGPGQADDAPPGATSGADFPR